MVSSKRQSAVGGKAAVTRRQTRIRAARRRLRCAIKPCRTRQSTVAQAEERHSGNPARHKTSPWFRKVPRVQAAREVNNVARQRAGPAKVRARCAGGTAVVQQVSRRKGNRGNERKIKRSPSKTARRSTAITATAVAGAAGSVRR